MKKGWSVLIVEDDAATANLISAELSSVKLVSRIAYSGQEALLATGTAVPDLLVVDLDLPEEFNGLETSRYFKYRYRDRTVPIVVMTDDNDPKIRAECADIGCDDYMVKPHDTDGFLESVDLLAKLSRNDRALHELKQEIEARSQIKSKRKLKKLETIEDNSVELIDTSCKLRLQIAEMLIERDLADFAKVHLEKIKALNSGHPAIKVLQSKLG